MCEHLKRSCKITLKHLNKWLVTTWAKWLHLALHPSDLSLKRPSTSTLLLSTLKNKRDWDLTQGSGKDETSKKYSKLYPPLHVVHRFPSQAQLPLETHFHIMSLRCSFQASNHYELPHLELLLFALITPLLLQPDDADGDGDGDVDAENGNNSDDDDLLFQPDSLLHLSEPLLQLLHLKIRLLLICTSLKI